MQQPFPKDSILPTGSNRSFHRIYALSKPDTNLDRDACPFELLIESLGRWIVRTLSAVAEAKQIPVAGSSVIIHMELIERNPWQTTFSVAFDLDNGLSSREQAILRNSAKSCEVSKMLGGPISFKFQ